MKIIDTHTHLPGNLLGKSAKTLTELREEFTRDGVSGAWIMTTDGLIRNPKPNNDLLAVQAAEHRDFFAAFCTVDPHEGEETCLREMERCKYGLGMTGLKLHPWLQSFSMSHPAVLPILKKCHELGFPVLFHDGTPPYCTPLQIAAAAEQAPETTIILGHTGLDDLTEDAILACLRHPNILLCLCALSAGRIADVIARCPADRLIYGSDGGFAPGLVNTAINKVRAACEDESLLEQIFHTNPQRILPIGV